MFALLLTTFHMFRCSDWVAGLSNWFQRHFGLHPLIKPFRNETRTERVKRQAKNTDNGQTVSGYIEALF